MHQRGNRLAALITACGTIYCGVYLVKGGLRIFLNDARYYQSINANQEPSLSSTFLCELETFHGSEYKIHRNLISSLERDYFLIIVFKYTMQQQINAPISGDNEVRDLACSRCGGNSESSLIRHTRIPFFLDSFPARGHRGPRRRRRMIDTRRHARTLAAIKRVY